MVTFRKKLVELQEDSKYFPINDEICKIHFRVLRSSKMGHHGAFNGLPDLPCYYLKRRQKELAKLLVERGHVRSILKMCNIPDDLKRDVYEMYQIANKDEKSIGSVYSVLSSLTEPISISELAQKSEIPYRTVCTSLMYLKKKGLVKRVKRGFYTS